MVFGLYAKKVEDACHLAVALVTVGEEERKQISMDLSVQKAVELVVEAAVEKE